MTIEQEVEDVGFLAIGATVPTPADAEETLKLTYKEIFGISGRYEELLDKMLESREFYELLERQQSL